MTSRSKCRPLKSSRAEADSIMPGVTAERRALQVCTRTRWRALHRSTLPAERYRQNPPDPSGLLAVCSNVPAERDGRARTALVGLRRVVHVDLREVQADVLGQTILTA